MKRYNPKEIESKWQKKWEESKALEEAKAVEEAKKAAADPKAKKPPAPAAKGKGKESDKP